MGIPLLRFLFRKMWNTRLMTFSTLAGLIIAVAFTTSIPMYADGSLKRVITKSLQEENSGLPAGTVLIRYQAVGSERPSLENFEQADRYMENEVPDMIGFPVFNFVRSLSTRNTAVTPADPGQVDPSKRREMSLMTLSDLENHIELTSGTMYSDEIKDGIIEAVVLEDAMYRNYFRVGDVFEYPVGGGMGLPPLKIKVVGAFQPKAGESVHDVYWFQGIEGLVNSFLISEQVFKEQLLAEQQVPLNMANWYYNFDLRDIRASQLRPLSETLDRLNIEVYQLLKNTRVDLSFQDMLKDFQRQSFQLQTMLFTLAAPMIAMVFYYIAMISRQSLERQRSDIAVLRSRGASTRQIVWIYVLEGLILGAAALVIGPMIGWFMAKSIGSSNGFLSFVNREAIPVDVGLSTLIYGLAGVLLAIASSVIPAIRYARSSIVGVRQQMARVDRKPVWQRWFLDVLLLAVSAYGWYLFYERQLLAARTGLGTDQLQVHPLLFFVPAVSIFALGLFFLRIFPWLLRLFGWLGRRFLPVPLYLTLTQLSRSAKGYYPLMLLLILTLGLGVYNSAAARTIDLNSTDRTLYQYGADVVITTVWESFAEFTPPPATPPGGGNNGGGGGNNGANNGNNGGGNNGGGGGGGGQPPPPPPPPRMLYREPPFEIFKTLPGVEHAARVLQTKGNAVVSGRTAGQGIVFGIDNVDFAEVAWFRNNDLLPLHQNYYLDQLGKYFDNAVIIPRNFAEKYNLEPGDVMNIAIEQQSLEFIVVATVPYWPTQYPDETPFFVVNLEYIYDQLPLIPYEVWLDMEDLALVTPVIEALAEAGIEVADVRDVRAELTAQARHPAKGGVFGILSLGFLVSVLISLVGYVMYWFFNLSSRVVQLGILRAMGLSRKQLTGMLLLEQGFTAGLSIVLGILIGKLASLLFLPFLQMSGEAASQVPPFRVVFDSQDTMRIYMVVFFMMLAGAALLFMHIRRLRVHQAIKLGEER